MLGSPRSTRLLESNFVRAAIGLRLARVREAPLTEVPVSLSQDTIDAETKRVDRGYLSFP